jgi:hypothetical protein
VKICDLSSGVGQLTQATSKLGDVWGEVKQSWDDGVRQEFEKNYIAEIPLRVRHLLGAAQRLAEVLDKAQKECDDHPTDS